MTIPEQWTEFCMLVPFHEPNTYEWVMERRNGVGASDVSTVLGFNRYRSAVDLWQEKAGRVGLIMDPPSPQAKWGHRLEPWIREDAEADFGVVISKPGTVQSLEWPWLRASVDGAMPDGGIFEAKSTCLWLADEWADGQVSDHAELQVQTAMAVTGAKRALVAAVIDRGYPEYRWVERDDVLIGMIVEATRAFWEHVETDVEPPIDGSASTRAALIARYPEHDDTAVIDKDGAAAVLAADYRAGLADEKAAKLRKDTAANQLRHLIAGGRRITTPEGAVVAGLKGGQIDVKALASQEPEIADDVTITETVSHISTALLKVRHPDIYTRYQNTSINVPKGS